MVTITAYPSATPTKDGTSCAELWATGKVGKVDTITRMWKRMGCEEWFVTKTPVVMNTGAGDMPGPGPNVLLALMGLAFVLAGGLSLVTKKKEVN